MSRTVITAYASKEDPLKLALLAKKNDLSSSQMVLKLIRDHYEKTYGDLDPALLLHH